MNFGHIENTEINNKFCFVCGDDIIKNNIVYYKINDIWKIYDFCQLCTTELLKRKWFDFIKNIKKADCEKELKALLNKKIPNKLTIDSTINSQEIDELYWNDNFISSHLIIPNHIDNSALNKKLNLISIKINENLIFDYLNEIKLLFEEFNL